MRIGITTAALTAAITVSLAVPNVQAEILVKRVRCADAALGSNPYLGVKAYHNQSGSTRLITLQIVRDGCRPKLEDGDLIFIVVESFSISVPWEFERLGNRTDAVQRYVQNADSARIWFQTQGGIKASGTFDYVLEVN